MSYRYGLALPHVLHVIFSTLRYPFAAEPGAGRHPSRNPIMIQQKQLAPPDTGDMDSAQPPHKLFAAVRPDPVPEQSLAVVFLSVSPVLLRIAVEAVLYLSVEVGLRHTEHLERARMLRSLVARTVALVEAPN